MSHINDFKNYIAESEKGGDREVAKLKKEILRVFEQPVAVPDFTKKGAHSRAKELDEILKGIAEVVAEFRKK